MGGGKQQGKKGARLERYTIVLEQLLITEVQVRVCGSKSTNPRQAMLQPSWLIRNHKCDAFAARSWDTM
jgi:hypothetical protein